jgi:hypothetical protein
MSLESKLVERPIDLPDHPYIAALKDFGLDELLAGASDAVTTSIASRLVCESLKPVILPFTGPVLEKVAFFPLHFHEAWKIYRTMPEDKRQSLGYYFKNALKDGSGNLLKDIMIHDPIYIGMMYLGLSQTDVHPGILSLMSYITGILLVAAIDVGKNELLFARKRKQLAKVGFKDEFYYEARFLISSSMDPLDTLGVFNKEFHLNSIGTIQYTDRYFETTLPSYSGRKPKLRLRTRRNRNCIEQVSWSPDASSVSTVQIVYTRAHENKKRLDQCRYFPAEKHKFFYRLSEPIMSLEDIPDTQLRAALLRCQPPQPHYSDISFERTIAGNSDIAICADTVIQDRPYYVVELKAYPHARRELLRAMRYIMVECPLAVHQTTQGKFDLFT